MKIQGLSATDKETKNKTRFSENGLDNLEKSGVGVPVNLDFVPGTDVGSVTKVYRQDGNVMIQANIDDSSASIFTKRLYCVPCVTILDKGKGIRDGVISKCIVRSFALTETPADPSLTPVEILEDD